jgi:hypothetical protein
MTSLGARLVVLGAALAAIGTVAPARAQLVRIPGTTVTMNAPPGFKIARGFRGLENPDTGSTITVGELPPDAYSELAQIFESPKTASSRYRDVHFTRIEQVTIGDEQIPLAIGGQKKQNKEVTRYIALLGGPKTNTNTTLINFEVADSASLGRGEIEDVLK